MTDPKERFSSRVENYSLYRPEYPSEIIKILRKECRISPTTVVADIGSGTGILTQLFLCSGHHVYAVEPNEEMRLEGERRLRGYAGFISVAGSAEKTTLRPESVDLVVVGQAFHWFHLEACKQEFARILKDPGYGVLIWNVRRTESTAFMRDYELLLRTYGTDYLEVSRSNIDKAALDAFFGRRCWRRKSVPNKQELDFDGLFGRLLSSSYAPEPGHPDHEPMVADLRRMFQRHQVDGSVSFDYDCVLYYGLLRDDDEFRSLRR